jgi:S1-C subfamily serine protease
MKSGKNMNTLIIDKCKEATGKIVCRDINRVGSGFFVGNQGFFITNNHVVAKMNIDNTGAIRLDYSKQTFVKISENIYKASLVIDENSDRPVVYDYAVLKVNGTPPAYFDVANVSEISQGDDVVAIGYPLDFDEAIVTTGVISAIISRPSHINALHRIRTFLTNVLVTYGNSGGPLIRASDGKAIGIITMPHEIRDEARERLLKYINLPGIEVIPPIRDLIEFVLRYLHIGFNYAISIEHVMNDPIFELHEGGS